MHPPIRRALIVDDLASTRQWLRQALALAFDAPQIDEAATLAQGHALAAQHAPDLALIDLGLPDGRGTTLIQALRANSPGRLIVIPTIFDDDAHLFEALRAGASAYVLKDQLPPRIALALQAIHQGQPPLSPSLARRLLSWEAGNPAGLDAVERRLLQLRSRGATHQEAAAAAGLDADTAHAAIRRLYDRLATIGSGIAIDS